MEVLGEWGECQSNNNLKKRSKSTQHSITSFWVLIKKPQHNKSERHSEKKLSRNILIRVVILINSKKSPMPTKP